MLQRRTVLGSYIIIDEPMQVVLGHISQEKYLGFHTKKLNILSHEENIMVIAFHKFKEESDNFLALH